MNKSLCLTFLLLSLVLSGCRIVIKPGAGGVVTTDSGSLQCSPGRPCIVEVTDTDFDEIFRAIPMEGYEFVGWKRGDGMFCGGKAEDCELNTLHFAGNGGLESMLDSPRDFYLQPQFRHLSETLSDKVIYIQPVGGGESTTILDVEGALVQVGTDESGDYLSTVRFSDGDVFAVRSSPDGVPMEFYTAELVVIFREFRANHVVISVIPHIGEPITGQVQYSPRLREKLSRIPALSHSLNIQSQSLADQGPTAMEPPLRYTSAAGSVTTIAKEVPDAVKSWDAARDIVKKGDVGKAVQHLGDGQKDKVVERIVERVRADNSGNTTEELQTRALINTGVCAASAAGGAVGAIEGCLALAEDAFTGLVVWAANVRNRFERRIERLLEENEAPLEEAQLRRAVAEVAREQRLHIQEYGLQISMLSPDGQPTVVRPVDYDATATLLVEDNNDAIDVDCVYLRAYNLSEDGTTLTTLATYEGGCLEDGTIRATEGQFTEYLPLLDEGWYYLRPEATVADKLFPGEGVYLDVRGVHPLVGTYSAVYRDLSNSCGELETDGGDIVIYENDDGAIFADIGFEKPLAVRHVFNGDLVAGPEGLSYREFDLRTSSVVQFRVTPDGELNGVESWSREDGCEGHLSMTGTLRR